MAARQRKVVWARSARSALDGVLQYIAQGSLAAAVQLLEDALEAGDSLASFSKRGRVVPEVENPAIREIFIHRYRLMYEVHETAITEVHETAITIVAFVHSSRDFSNWRKQIEQDAG